MIINNKWYKEVIIPKVCIFNSVSSFSFKMKKRASGFTCALKEAFVSLCPLGEVAVN